MKLVGRNRADLHADKLRRHASAAHRPIRGFSDSARRLLETYDWPGNVRELENAIERAVALETGEVITESSLPDNLRRGASGGQKMDISIPMEDFDLEAHLEEMRKKFVERAMEISGNKQTEAARLLGMTPRSIRYLLDKYDLK